MAPLSSLLPELSLSPMEGWFGGRREGSVKGRKHVAGKNPQNEGCGDFYYSGLYCGRFVPD
uniref:Uncharacterized protein n=1 Tax=Nelumbo nucifera TaxID=4432 RepID=A0A822YPC3_NELNU|nr:TPA_asm: hypothetical protein HUJ06_012272 [Nelumbo nucifera]